MRLSRPILITNNNEPVGILKPIEYGEGTILGITDKAPEDRDHVIFPGAIAELPQQLGVRTLRFAASRSDKPMSVEIDALEQGIREHFRYERPSNQSPVNHIRPSALVDPFAMLAFRCHAENRIMTLDELRVRAARFLKRPHQELTRLDLDNIFRSSFKQQNSL